MKINLNLDVQKVQLILEALAGLPYARVAEVIAEIQIEGQKQVQEQEQEQNSKE